MIRIGLINTNREPYPSPRGVTNGGLAITGILADSLSGDLFEPYFFTASDSRSRAKTESFGEPSYFFETNGKVLEKAYSPEDTVRIVQKEQDLFVKAVSFCRKEGIKILHVHNNIFNVAPLLQNIRIPVIFTSHDPITEKHAEVIKGLRNFYFVTISKKQQQEAVKFHVPVYATIYNGIDTDLYSFSPKSGNRMLFVGRLVAYKGIREAIMSSISTEHALDLVGQYGLKPHDKDITDECRGRLESNPHLLAHYPLLQKSQIIEKYRQAKLTLFPSINREEPFGLVPVESMSCGTPVVAFGQGALPELIRDGITGFLVNTSPQDIRGDWVIKQTGLQGLIEGIKRIYALSETEYEIMRGRCREHAQNSFSLKTMVTAYEKLYLQILSIKKTL